MTVDEVIAAQRGWSKNHGSSAAGGYQFMRDTLIGLKKELGLRGSRDAAPSLVRHRRNGRRGRVPHLVAHPRLPRRQVSRARGSACPLNRNPPRKEPRR